MQLVQAKIDGETSENGFKKRVWNRIAASFEELPRWMKKEYKEVRKLHKKACGLRVKGSHSAMQPFRAFTNAYSRVHSFMVSQTDFE
jgi:hypothetical protein